MSEQFLFLEDDERSIEPEIAIVCKVGLEPVVRPEPFMFADYLASDAGAYVVGAALDMHNPKVKDLEQIERKHVQTENGEVTGLAFAESYLREPNAEYRDLPLSFLTGYKVLQRHRKRIRALARDPDDAQLFTKGEHDELFEHFVRAAQNRRLQTKQDDEMVYLETVQVCRRILEELFDDAGLRLRSFGIVPDGKIDLNGAEKALQSVQSIDMRDRAVLVIDMKTRLDALLGEDLARQREWLAASQDFLDGKPPLALLRSGRLHEIARVVGLLKQVTG